MSGDALLGLTLRQLREAKGISLKAAAAAIGTDRHATVSEIESGRRKATFAETAKLAAAYGATLPDVIEAMAGRESSVVIAVALPRATGALEDVDRAAVARLERLARDYAALKSVLSE